MNKIYTIEETIEINNQIDFCLSHSRNEDFISILNGIHDSNIIDSAFVKYFNEMVELEKIKEARWFLVTILPFVSFKALLKVFKNSLAFDFLNTEKKIEIFDTFIFLLKQEDWEGLVRSDIYSFQIILLAQLTSRDFSFYWETLSDEALSKIRKNLHLKPFVLGNGSLKKVLLDVFRGCSPSNIVRELKNTVVAISNNIQNPQLSLLPVLSTMTKIIYQFGSIQDLKDWDEYIGWINSNVLEEYRYSTMDDFVFNVSLNVCEKNGFFLISVAEDLRKYFIKDIFHQAYERHGCVESNDVSDEVFKI